MVLALSWHKLVGPFGVEGLKGIFLTLTCKIGDTVPGWAAKADLNLIEQSAKEFNEVVNTLQKPAYLAYPGIGAGELSREEVEKVLEPILNPDNIYLCTLT